MNTVNKWMRMRKIFVMKIYMKKVKIHEEYEDEEKSETHDVDPDLNDIQGEDHDDNPQCTSTPERNIFLMLILNLVVSYVIKLKTVSYAPMFHFITCCFFFNLDNLFNN